MLVCPWLHFVCWLHSSSLCVFYFNEMEIWLECDACGAFSFSLQTRECWLRRLHAAEDQLHLLPPRYFTVFLNDSGSVAQMQASFLTFALFNKHIINNIYTTFVDFFVFNSDVTAHRIKVRKLWMADSHHPGDGLNCIHRIKPVWMNRDNGNAQVASLPLRQIKKQVF